MVWWQMEELRWRSWFGLFWGLSLLTLSGWNPGFGATLVWNANPPEEGIAHYTVYVDSPNAPTQTNIITGTNFPLTQLLRGIFYTLRVTATDTNGVESLPSYIDFVVPLPPEIT